MRSKTRFVGMLTVAVALLTSSFSKGDAPAAKKESISVLGKATLTVPVGFERVQPRFGMIQHEFQAKAGEGDDAATARVTMMPASGGVSGNIDRWKEQFVGGKAESQKTQQMKLGDWQVHIVDVSGSYAERTGGGPFAGGKIINHQNHAMIGAIMVNPDGGPNFFVKLIGPMAVVKANRDAFVAMIKSIEQ